MCVALCQPVPNHHVKRRPLPRNWSQDPLKRNSSSWFVFLAMWCMHKCLWPCNYSKLENFCLTIIVPFFYWVFFLKVLLFSRSMKFPWNDNEIIKNTQHDIKVPFTVKIPGWILKKSSSVFMAKGKKEGLTCESSSRSLKNTCDGILVFATVKTLL